MKYKDAENYWNRAGEVSYNSAMYANDAIAQHINHRLWNAGVEVGRELGLDKKAHVLDLGCGDGTLSNLVLSHHYRAIDGFDLSSPAIQRARDHAPHEHIQFSACDITTLDYTQLPRYDGAYLWGILHHVKDATPQILSSLSTCVKRLVILEPNGNHIVRKLLEQTKSYKEAGEDSFRTKTLKDLFIRSGFTIYSQKSLNIFPNFTPKRMFHALKPLESMIEQTPLIKTLCTVNIWGLVSNNIQSKEDASC